MVTTLTHNFCIKAGLNPHSMIASTTELELLKYCESLFPVEWQALVTEVQTADLTTTSVICTDPHTSTTYAGHIFKFHNSEFSQCTDLAPQSPTPPTTTVENDNLPTRARSPTSRHAGRSRSPRPGPTSDTTIDTSNNSGSSERSTAGGSSERSTAGGSSERSTAGGSSERSTAGGSSERST
eukprot:Lankesteria_metandrocarpae@DN9872_c0_g1_i1.p1